MYIGTKIVELTPMTRAEYNDYRGWVLPQDENGDDEGYLVEYTDGGETNDPRHKGYISWSPKASADKAYRKTEGLSFGLALEAARHFGKRIARSGWNGKDQFVYYIPGSDFQKALGYGFGEYFDEPTIVGGFAIKTTANKIQIGWLASQADMCADDWMIL